jgi:DNA-binding MarR family transcriptional regulator
LSSRLQAELKQTKPFASATHEATLGILKTADLLKRTLDRNLAQRGLSGQQYNVLRILQGAGPEGIATLAIGERLIEQTPGTTRLLDRMEQKGLVRRKRCPLDRRQVLCYGTAQGTRLIQELEPVIEGVGSGSFEGIGDQELERLIETLERVRERAERQLPGGP